MNSLIRRLTRFSHDSPLGALARAPLRLLPKTHVATVRSGLNQGAQWVVGSSTHGCWLGTYEQDKQELVAKIVRAGMVAWDVGANAGYYTLAFSRLAGNAGRVFAFEPFAGNVHYLLRHIELNGRANVTVVQAALDRQSGLAGFQIGAGGELGHLTDKDSSYVVPTLAPDDFIGRRPAAMPDLIKIDVEGAESAVLQGAAQLLSGRGPEILLALHGGEQKQKCFQILVAHRYQVFDLAGHELMAENFAADEIYATRRPS